MSDVPERMYVNWRPGLGVTNGPLVDSYQGWVRLDLYTAAIARAEAAEARERAAWIAGRDAAAAEFSRYGGGADNRARANFSISRMTPPDNIGGNDDK